MSFRGMAPRTNWVHQLLSDRGSEFESQLFSQLMSWLGIDKLRTTAYKPSTNGVVERFHRTPERVRRPPLSLQDYHTTDDRGRRMIRAASMLAESLCAAVRAGRANTTQVVQARTPAFHADICGTEATRGEVQVPASTVPASTVQGVRAV